MEKREITSEGINSLINREVWRKYGIKIVRKKNLYRK